MNVLRPVGAIARYATFGGASIAAYDCAVGDGSMVSHIIKQLVASAASSRAPEFPTLALAPAAVDHAMRLHGQELAELSAKLDVLTRVSLSHLAGRGGASRVPIGTLLCAAGVVFGGLAAWAIATGRWWPTVNAKLEGIEQSISVVDAKIDMRAAELAAQLVDQHQQVLSALSCVSANVDDKVGAVDLKVGAIETKLDRLERRIVEMDDMERENNRGACRPPHPARRARSSALRRASRAPARCSLARADAAAHAPALARRPPAAHPPP
jgi:hypothetical protein